MILASQAEESESVEVAFKRSTNINLSDFYNLVERHEGERKAEFEPFLKLTQEDIDNFSAEIIREEAEHKLSDRNILHDLDFLASPADSPARKTEEFKREMERLHSKQQAPDQLAGSFHNELRISEEASSESLLLNPSDRPSQRERLVEEVEQALILDFCVAILRSKTLLHNFITTYS